MNLVANAWTMRAFILGLFALLLGSLVGCADQDRLVVYADPWLKDYALEMKVAFQATHPETDIQLKVISSEVIAQYIHFGQPVDVALMFGAELLQENDWQAQIAERSTLASTQMVFLNRADSIYLQKQIAFRSRHAVMLEASDRPARRYAELAGFGFNDLKSEVQIANFQAQAEDYLLRGWVPSGIVPLHFAKSHAANFTEFKRGPLIPNAFTSVLLTNAPHPALANAFFTATGAEKSLKILGELKFLP